MDDQWLGKKLEDILPLGYRDICTKYYKLRAFYDGRLKLWRIGRLSYKFGWAALVNVEGLSTDYNGFIARKYKTVVLRQRKRFLKLVRKGRKTCRVSEATRRWTPGHTKIVKLRMS
jgi:hypothetical protein